MNNKNQAEELRKYLFDQLDRLSDPQANLEVELKRADALAKVGTVIVNSHKQEIYFYKLSGARKPSGAKQIEMKPIKGKKVSSGK